MGYGIIDTSTLTDIADAIRGKLGVQTVERRILSGAGDTVFEDIAA